MQLTVPRTIYTVKPRHAFADNVTFELDLSFNKIHWRYINKRRTNSSTSQFFKSTNAIINFNGFSYQVQFVYKGTPMDFYINTYEVLPGVENEDEYHTHNLRAESDLFHLVAWSGTSLSFKKIDFKQLAINE